MPGDVPDWIRRRGQACRDPPRPMQGFSHHGNPSEAAPAYEDSPDLYELDAEPHPTPGAGDNAIPRIVSLGNDDDDLAKAIALSQQEALSAPRRASTGGFDENEIAEALNRSLLVSER